MRAIMIILRRTPCVFEMRKLKQQIQFKQHTRTGRVIHPYQHSYEESKNWNNKPKKLFTHSLMELSPS
jgi:hypothetical protein